MEPVSLSAEEIRLALEVGKSAWKCLEAGSPRIEIPGSAWAFGSRPDNWAVLPASFNPPTLAHQFMVHWALEKGGFQGVLLLLDLRHADKPPQDAHLLDRYLMIRLGLSLNDRTLIGLSSHGLFLEKARAISGLSPAPVNWSFLVGEDTMARILDPRFYSSAQEELGELFSRASFVVFERPGGFPRSSPREFPLVSSPENIRTISSSLVRQNRFLNLPWRELLCPEVAHFIELTGLYLPEPNTYEARRRQLEDLFRARVSRRTG